MWVSRKASYIKYNTAPLDWIAKVFAVIDNWCFQHLQTQQYSAAVIFTWQNNNYLSYKTLKHTIGLYFDTYVAFLTICHHKACLLGKPDIGIIADNGGRMGYTDVGSNPFINTLDFSHIHDWLCNDLNI